jgi:hypothetical protein
LICESGEIAQEVAHRFDVLVEGCKPVIVRHHAAQPLPDAFLRIQLGRVGVVLSAQGVRRLAERSPQDAVIALPQPHILKRTTQSVLEDLFGLPLSVGTRTNLERATVRALAEPVAEARAYVQAQPAVYVDETGWREGRARAWLWTAVTTWVTVFVVRLSRSAKVAQELLGGTVLGVDGDGSQERLHMVSRVAAAALQGPSVARHRSHD